MSQRGAEMLREEMELPAAAAQAVSSRRPRAGSSAVVRRLEDAGAIVIRRGAGGEEEVDVSAPPSSTSSALEAPSTPSSSRRAPPRADDVLSAGARRGRRDARGRRSRGLRGRVARGAGQLVGPALEALGSRRRSAAGASSRVAAERVEAHAVDLALLLAEQVVGAAIAVEPELVLEAVRGALRRLVERERVPCS